MNVQHFFDPRTSSLTYVVFDAETRDAVVIDPVLDYDPKSGRTSTASVERVAAFLDEHGLVLRFALDTHPHADHLTALPWLRERYGARTVVGAGITGVQETWRDVFHLGERLPVDGSQFDILLEDGETLEAGALAIEGLLTEGHTPASMTYRIGDALFVGDLLFMPDAGTARCDFPGGSAAVMYDAVKRLYRFPDSTGLHAPRLPAGGPRARVREHHRRAEALQRAPARRHDQGGVRRAPRRARGRQGDADAALPRRAGQRERRAPARAGGERRLVPEDPARPLLVDAMRDRARLAAVIPALSWARGYRRDDLPSDLLAGTIVAIMLVPQAMAYAMLAGLAAPGRPVRVSITAPLALYAPVRQRAGRSRSHRWRWTLSSSRPAAWVPLAGGRHPASTWGPSGLLLALMVGVLQVVMGSRCAWGSS